MSEQKTIKNRPKICPTGWCDCFSCHHRRDDDCTYSEQDGLLLTEDEYTKWVQTHQGIQRSPALCNRLAQLAKAKQHYHPSIEAQKLQVELAKKQEAEAMIRCIKDAKRVHPDWAVDDVIELLQFREETRQALKGETDDKEII